MRNPTQNSDPWNWGWDDSGNTEQVNNNTTTDPRWNWGVENTYQDGQHGYGQYEQHQSWSAPSQQDTSMEYRNATCHNQHPIPNTIAISDSFNLTSHSENAMFQKTPPVVKTEVKSEISYSERFSPASAFFNQDSFNQSQSSQHNYTQDAMSFNQSQSSVATSQPQTDFSSFTSSPEENVNKPIENATVDDGDIKNTINSVNESILSGASSIFHSVRNDSTECSNESIGVSDLKPRKDRDLSDTSNDVPYQSDLKVENSSVEQDNQNHDRLSSQWSTESLASQEINKSNSSTGNNGLSSQWSTESLPSQASDERSQAAEGNEHLSVPPVSQGEMLQNHNNQGDQYDQFLQMYSNEVLQSNKTIPVATAVEHASMLNETLNIRYEEVHTESVSATNTAMSQPPPSAEAGAEALVIENSNLKIGEVENEEIIYPQDKALGSKGKSLFNVPKYKGPSPTLECASGITERKSFSQVGITSSVVSDLGTQFKGLSLQSDYVSNNVESLDNIQRISSTHRTEDGVNMETVPDNEERPDVVDLHQPSPVERQSMSSGLRNDMFCPVGQVYNISKYNSIHNIHVKELSLLVKTLSVTFSENEFLIPLEMSDHALCCDEQLCDAEREPASQWLLQSNYSASPENQEVAPRPDRNQYLETGQLNEDGDTRSTIPEGFLRMVPGQITEQNASANIRVPTQILDTSNSSISLSSNVSHSRMVPGQLNRMVPGQLNESALTEDLDTNLTVETSVDDDLSLRMVPGQLTEESDSNVNMGAATVRNSADDIPPPGLRRMIPGESSSPESQGNSTVMLQPSASTFQPLPLEPRVVTGVAQDEMDTGNSVTVLQQPSSPSPGSRIIETESPLPDQTSNSLPQPPSERSETIGSDGVDSFQPVTSDVNIVRDTRNQIGIYNPDIIIGTDSWLREDINDVEYFRTDFKNI
ncbi:hypothetical protein C0J52_22654 [Blattella germanica]|nr:hypothetical protein C0J52_22654 [Blattella germanica]